MRARGASGASEAWGVMEVEEERKVKTNQQKAIKEHRELEIYKKAFDAAMEIFQLSKKFPVEERYSLTDQIRRSSRSVCANFAEAWRKRRYEAAFIAKLNGCEAESAETQTWLEFAVKCDYMEIEVGCRLYGTYN